jgi:DNA (cytosine-5)-methyltransferase 1
MHPVAVDVYNQAIDGQTAATPTEACGGTNTSGPKVMQSVAFSEVGATLKGGSGERGYPDPSDGNGHNIVGQSVAPTLTATNDPSRSPQSSEVTKQVEAVLMASTAVRRLTPKECERLQGFPDNYTEIPWRGKTETPDGPRYKALGNSMAVPVMKWIGDRIEGIK